MVLQGFIPMKLICNPLTAPPAARREK